MVHVTATWCSNKALGCEVKVRVKVVVVEDFQISIPCGNLKAYFQYKVCSLKIQAVSVAQW